MTDQTPSISIPLFPVPICLYNYGKDNHELNLSLISDISKEVENDPVGETRSNFGGWHSYDDLETKYKSFDKLRNQIQESSNNYCTKHGYKSGLVCKKMWANINETGHMNVGHHHGNAALTGVYYPVEKIIDSKGIFNYTDKNPIQPGIWDGKNGGSIYFQDPSYGLKTKLIKSNIAPTAYNLDTYYMYPVAGLLILFPSYLIHTVTPFTEDMKRVSISFTADYD
tara:strand:+ start:536 stop:1210 length:675 start_codon:yes stop_codon:yes gene_type:complete